MNRAIEKMIASLFPLTAPCATKKVFHVETCGSITIQRLETARGLNQFALFVLWDAEPER